MVAKKNIVNFYWDPVCPWCWITSRWMIEVGRQKQIQVNWKLFSLNIINADREIPEPYKTLHEIGLKALRVAAAVRRSYGNDGLAKVYTLMGTHYHHDEQDIDTPEDLEKILQTGGFATRLAQAATDPEWDTMIRADMDQAHSEKISADLIYCKNSYKDRFRLVQKLALTRTVGADDPKTVCEFLAAFTSLSKNRIKDAMAKGAVWLIRSKRGCHAVRFIPETAYYQTVCGAGKRTSRQNQTRRRHHI